MAAAPAPSADLAPPVRADYRLRARSLDEAVDRAEAMAREQTLEVPSGAASPALEAAYLGRVLAVEALRAGDDGARGRDPGGLTFRVRLAYPDALFDGAVTQFLNLVWGNISLMDDVVLEDLHLPERILGHFPGPALGIPGLRERAGGITGRPLVSGALKPVGLTSEALARLAATLARAGMDVIKDDHGLTDQSMSPFHERVAAVAGAVAETNGRTGGHTLYFPNVTAGVDAMSLRAEAALAAGCAGVVVCPGLTGLDAMRALRERFPELAIMAHPSHANATPAAVHGITPPLLMGTLWRLAGADCAVYVNARGRFAWPVETCLAINHRARAPLGSHLPAFPVPAGGVQAGEVKDWFRLYGPDTLLLVGGSILEAPDVERAARAVVEAARAAASAPARPPAGTPAEGGRP